MVTVRCLHGSTLIWGLPVVRSRPPPPPRPQAPLLLLSSWKVSPIIRRRNSSATVRAARTPPSPPQREAPAVIARQEDGVGHRSIRSSRGSARMLWAAMRLLIGRLSTVVR